MVSRCDPREQRRRSPCRQAASSSVRLAEVARDDRLCSVEESPDLLPWDKRLLALLPSGVDTSQLRENLRLSPTERLEQMLELQAFIAENRGRARVRPPSSR